MRGTRLWVVAAACASWACSSSSSGLNIDASKRIVTLSLSEQRSLCDWMAQQYGGYGQAKYCGGSSTIVAPLTAHPDQPTCVSAVSAMPPGANTCAATVGNVERCLQWKLDNVCGGGTAPTDCAPVTNNPNCPKVF